MNRGKVLAGLDAGHVDTKAVLMRGGEILGYSTVPTGFDVAASARTALDHALRDAGVSGGEPDGIVATGIFRDVVRASLNVSGTVPEYAADARGALFLDKGSRTVIDMGGNIQKAIRYDEKGDLLDVVQNDKCADGLGIFYTTMAGALGLSEQEMSDAALKSASDVSIAIQCALSAESEAIDLVCRGVEAADVANAVLKFIADRVAAMCTSMSLENKVVVAGGLARSKTLVGHIRSFVSREVSVLDLPEYVGAIGAVVGYEG